MPEGIEGRHYASAFALVMAAASYSASCAGNESPHSAGLAESFSIQRLAALPAHSEGDGERRDTVAPEAMLKPSTSPIGLRGYVQTEVARTYANPDHWSK